MTLTRASLLLLARESSPRLGGTLPRLLSLPLSHSRRIQLSPNTAAVAEAVATQVADSAEAMAADSVAVATRAAAARLLMAAHP
jgi:hypothetical protein